MPERRVSEIGQTEVFLSGSAAALSTSSLVGIFANRVTPATSFTVRGSKGCQSDVFLDAAAKKSTGGPFHVTRRSAIEENFPAGFGNRNRPT